VCLIMSSVRVCVVCMCSMCVCVCVCVRVRVYWPGMEERGDGVDTHRGGCTAYIHTPQPRHTYTHTITRATDIKAHAYTSTPHTHTYTRSAHTNKHTCTLAVPTLTVSVAHLPPPRVSLLVSPAAAQEGRSGHPETPHVHPASDSAQVGE